MIAAEGAWSLNSKIDPRWNHEGRGLISVSSGYIGGLDEKISELKNKFGQPPKDLTIDAIKD